MPGRRASPILPILIALLASCATPPTSAPPPPPEAGRDSIGERIPSFPIFDARLEARVEDRAAAPKEAGLRCEDPKPNDTCSTALALPKAVLGKGWSTVTASTIGDGDLDWFELPAERQDPCAPLFPQCLTLTVRITVPAGRRLRLCAREKDCGASATCADSPADLKTGHDLTVAVEHKGLCTSPVPPFAEARALVSISCLDGVLECATYSLAGRLELCAQ